jgi:N-acetylmuramoyl-L-alanine amidase
VVQVINIRQKLSDQKFWALLAAFMVAVIIVRQDSSGAIPEISGAVLALGAMVSYILGESKVEVEYGNRANGDFINSVAKKIESDIYREEKTVVLTRPARAILKCRANAKAPTHIEDRLLTPGREHGRPQTPLTPKGIVIHYVGNPGSSAEANRNWFESGANGARTSAHYIIGLKGEILRCIPENERAMHAGKAYGDKWEEQAAKNNSTYLGIECCHPDLTGAFNDKTCAALIWLCVDICKRYGLDPLTNIFRHYDVTGKLCPRFYVDNEDAWKDLLDGINAESKATAIANAPDDWAKTAWEWARVNNYNDGTRPRDYATRQEVAAIVYRVFGNLEAKP